MKRIGLFLLIFSVAGPLNADPLVNELKARALRYFVDHTNPKNGLVRDRAVNHKLEPRRKSDYQMASIAATGFGYAILTHAAGTGRLDPKATEAQIYRGLKFALEKIPHYKGWFFHFIDWETGARFAGSEISTVDTAWFLAGALYAGQIWGGRVAELARQLYERVDFIAMMTHDGALPNKRTLSMGWLPESGYLPYQWDSYAEHLLLLLLGLGHPKRPLPTAAWTAWSRPKMNEREASDLPLFIHQYSHWFVDFRNRQDRFGNYFLVSQRATHRDRLFCAEQKNSATYRAGFWGLSASGSAEGYFAFSPLQHNGTVCPSCAVGSYFLDQALVIEDVRRWINGPYGPRLWGEYGLSDSVNLDRGWFDTDVIGITVAGVYFAVVNGQDGSFWKVFEQISPLSRGLVRAGFRGAKTAPGPALLRQ